MPQNSIQEFEVFDVWAIDALNFDLKSVGEKRFFDLNELE